MITITEIKEIKNKWLKRRVISHQEIGELLDFGFQLHQELEQKEKELAQYKNVVGSLPDVVQLEIK